MRKWSCCGRGILTIKSYYKRNNKNYKTRHVCIGRTSRSSSTISSSTPLGCYVHSGLSAGLIPYIRGHAWQTGLLHQYLSSSSSCDRLLLFQHEPVYTLGRGADEHHLLFLTNPKTNDLPHEEEAQQNILTLLCRSNRSSPAHLSFSSNHTIHIKSLSIPSDVHNNGKLLYDEMDIGEEEEGRGSQLPTRRSAYAGPVVKAPNGAAIYRVERGGQVTFHGPGMLVVYPLLDLRRYKQDLHWYLRQIEQVIIEVLKLYHISAYRDEPDTGVWVNGNKIAAVGISASRWITTHGFAINISPDLATYFDPAIIIPCGISSKGVTSMEQELQSTVCIHDVAQQVQTCFENVFGVPLIPGDNLH